MSFSYPFVRRRCNPFRSCYVPSHLLDQDFGLPPLSEEPLRDWMEWVENQLNTSSPGRSRSNPADSAAPSHCLPSLQQQLSGGMSLIQQTVGNWKISLDVKHFTPEELQVKIQEGYLEISGSHKERQDQHGFISRNFTRKYKFPPDVDTLLVTSSLTPDGILIVEAPLPNPAVQVPVEIMVPVQKEVKSEEVDTEKDKEIEKGVEQEKEPEMEHEKEPEEDQEVPREQDKDKETQQEREPEKEEAEQEKVVQQEEEKEVTQ
ncbi:heat shock protein beta-1 [Scyliorhinus canicula]|uniref:heat shock protein beta-1 n=1 Tax=Scyliorhinus canicula TaxID=7830 RepID=UPI0018F3EA83|nr:heat shock protein beta-1 [Scyliorhinus canicula]